MTNPFISFDQKKTFSTRDEAIPFDQIKTEDFIPAIDYSLKKARETIQKIKTDKSPANFANTVLALESASELYETVNTVYWNLFSAHATEAHQALAKDISARNAEFGSEISLDDQLFARIKEVYDNRDTLKLSGEELKATEKYYRDFTRNGALLSKTDKDKLKKIDQQLAAIGPEYSENLLKSTNAFELWIDDKADLVGLPESTIESSAMDAEKKGRPGKWLFTLQAPSYIPFMTYAQNRELRKKLWFAFNSKSFNDSFDNQKAVLEIVRLRHERAALLGFKSHAHYVLAERMAETPERVMDFLNKLLDPSRKAADKEIGEIKAFKKTIDGNEDIMPWDFAYFSEKLKQKKYSFNSEELRPFFKLENVIEGVFEHSRRLYNLTFKEVLEVPKYHPDVRVFEVREQFTQKYIGLLSMDFFPRETKRGGAWMTSMREQGLMFGKVQRPHIGIVCNFTKPTASKPSLLTYDEVKTLFHEFGHALHGLLSQVTYRSLSGTNVYWDFVELPSQIMENWVGEKEGLDIFARNYQTGETIPEMLMAKMKKAEQFQTGYNSMRQLSFALLDMAWHTGNVTPTTAVDKFEDDVLSPLRVLPKVTGTNSSCQFSHIFAGGYSAGYYSYKWAEVLDADAFEFFKEKGIFNSEVADKFRENILSRGGTEHPMELYKKFRGREPDPAALLRREGLSHL